MPSRVQGWVPFLCLVKKSQQKLGSQAKPMFIQKGQFYQTFKEKAQDRTAVSRYQAAMQRRRKPVLLALILHESQPCGADSHVMGSGFRESLTFKVPGKAVRKEVERRERS